MKKKLAIILGIVLGFVFIPGGMVLATGGVDEFTAYVEALEYGLLGLIEYFKFVIELFEAAI